MVLIYTNTISPRLVYITGFLFRELLGIDCASTTNVDEYLLHPGVRLNYSNHTLCEGEIQIIPHALLFEQGTKAQDITFFSFNGDPAYFKTGGGDFPFDLFAAAFYLLSRCLGF